LLSVETLLERKKKAVHMSEIEPPFIEQDLMGWEGFEVAVESRSG
jgi:hypothetical protein